MRTDQGRRPVKEFFDGLSKGAKAKVYAALTMLEREGNRLGFPKSKSLGQGLHELRIPHPQGPFRIIYCFQPDRRVVLLHAFVKRTEQIPGRELELARKRKPRQIRVRRSGGKPWLGEGP
ncbi:MAG: type II toxin-antitoxin system RelE/ParE family toxin [Candidatus Methylomirabilia bacterium]